MRLRDITDARYGHLVCDGSQIYYAYLIHPSPFYTKSTKLNVARAGRDPTVDLSVPTLVSSYQAIMMSS